MIKKNLVSRNYQERIRENHPTHSYMYYPHIMTVMIYGITLRDPSAHPLQSSLGGGGGGGGGGRSEGQGLYISHNYCIATYIIIQEFLTMIECPLFRSS